MPTYRLLIEYDGTHYHGWQVQPGQPTVQEAVESALQVIVRTRPKVVGSGRTDAGVHARGQVAHFTTNVAIDANRLRGSLNGILPPDVAVISLEETYPHFHARFDARERRYRYYISTVECALERKMRRLIRPVPDFTLMNAASAALAGRHDFGAFCRTRSGTANRVCIVNKARWIQEDYAPYWYFEITADRFLQGMVRAIVGTLLQIGTGKRPPEDLERVLKSQDRRMAGPAVPPYGLILEEVLYGDPCRNSIDQQEIPDSE